MNLSASVSVGLLAFTTVAAVLMVASRVAGDGPPVVFIIVVLSSFAFAWYLGLFVGVLEVRFWPDDGRLEFRSFLRARETNVSDIVGVECRQWVGPNRPAVSIRYRGGGYRRPVARLGNEKASRDLVQRIQECDPSIEIKGRPFDPWRTT